MFVFLVSYLLGAPLAVSEPVRARVPALTRVAHAAAPPGHTDQYCQAQVPSQSPKSKSQIQVPNPSPKSKSQIQSLNAKVQRKGTRTRADSKILEATTPSP